MYDCYLPKESLPYAETYFALRLARISALRLVFDSDREYPGFYSRLYNKVKARGKSMPRPATVYQIDRP